MEAGRCLKERHLGSFKSLILHSFADSSGYLTGGLVCATTPPHYRACAVEESVTRIYFQLERTIRFSPSCGRAGGICDGLADDSPTENHGDCDQLSQWGMWIGLGEVFDQKIFLNREKRACGTWCRFLSIYSWTQSWTASSQSPELKWPPSQSWPSKPKRYKILKIPFLRGHGKLIFTMRYLLHRVDKTDGIIVFFLSSITSTS